MLLVARGNRDDNGILELWMEVSQPCMKIFSRKNGGHINTEFLIRPDGSWFKVYGGHLNDEIDKD